MEILLQNIGRRFNKEWIFRGIDYAFKQGEAYAILGANGSGKSTLLSVLLSSLTPSEGEIKYQYEGREIAPQDVFRYISFAAPYLDLIEEFTLQESIDFHFQFKQQTNLMTTKNLIEVMGLEKAKDKALKNFSSGMKQRTKLALACCADTPILILDEPTSNLDQQGVLWYQQLVEKFAKGKLVLIGSNQRHEYDFCEKQLLISEFKG